MSVFGKVLFCFAMIAAAAASGATYHLDSTAGDDGNDGLSSQTAWKSLEKAGGAALVPGDRLLLRRGSVFDGSLALKVQGSKQKPIIVDAYGESPALPVIDARGHLAGIHLSGCSYLEIANLEIMADAGKVQGDEKARTERFGVFSTTYRQGGSPHIHLRNLFIHDIFATEQLGKLGTKGKNENSNLGMGIKFESGRQGCFTSDILIENCRIERTGHTGIKFSGSGTDPEFYNQDIRVVGNHLKIIGGPGIQPGRVKNMVVRGNVVDHSGASSDPRMHARGSGIWPWSSQNVIIEENRFMHARGLGDSCGIHIDFNCRDIVVQRNFSLDNEGGFIEILGKNHNCSYRYNISVNDGFRTKGENGAHQEGKILWFSGYVGSKKDRVGPFNSYIYNNTIYVKPKSRACFSVNGTADGILIANNIFHILGDTVNVPGDQKAWKKGRKEPPPKNVVFENNLYMRSSTLPADLPIRDGRKMVGDAGFGNPGGFEPEDYIPGNRSVVKDKGIVIEKLPNDDIGLKVGLKVEKDFFGNPIQGRPDLGAVELQK